MFISQTNATRPVQGGLMPIVTNNARQQKGVVGLGGSNTITYPIMAGEHDMVRTKASIPVGMFTGNDIDVVYNSPSNGIGVKGFRIVEIMNQHDNTEWKEINQCLIGVLGSIKFALFQFMNEPSL